MEPSGSFPASLIICHAVYGWRRGSIYLYIGHSSKFLKRFAGHHVINVVDKVEPTDELDYWICKSYTEELDLEHILIKLYNPPYNKVGNKLSSLVELSEESKANLDRELKSLKQIQLTSASKIKREKARKMEKRITEKLKTAIYKAEMIPSKEETTLSKVLDEYKRKGPQAVLQGIRFNVDK